MKNFAWAMIMAAVASTAVVALIDYATRVDDEWERNHQ